MSDKEIVRGSEYLASLGFVEAIGTNENGETIWAITEKGHAFRRRAN